MARRDDPPSSIRQLVGRVVGTHGRYAISGVLGEGSQAATLEAVDKLDGRPVAIKRFQVRGAKSWKDVEMAEREARVLGQLDHRLLPAAIDHFEEDGALYLVMEKIEGATLDRVGRQGEDEVVQFLEDAGEVLDYLHGRAPPVIHRDIKPRNVIVRPATKAEERASYVLVDFGSVRDSLEPAGGSTVVGTFGYMAPEQFQGRAMPQSDVYAVGATALFMLTGIEPEDLPHKGLAIDVVRALPGRDPALVAALTKMVEPDPDRRATRIAPLLAELRQERGAEGGRGTGHEERERRRQEHKRRREGRADRRKRDRGPEPPLPPLIRAVVRLALAIAALAVWATTQVVVPTVLVLLSLAFGRALRDAARAVIAGGARANRAIGRTRRALTGSQPAADTTGRSRGAQREQRRKERVGRTRIEPPRRVEIADDDEVKEMIAEVEGAVDEAVEEVERELDRHRRR